MKSPDEVKKDAETCMNHPHTYSCNSCQLYSECHGIAEHIIKELYDLVVSYESRLAQVERERDALLDDLRHSFDPCTVCKKQDNCEQYCPDNDYNCPDCKDKHRCICHNCTADNDLWEWRGICSENAKEE